MGSILQNLAYDAVSLRIILSSVPALLGFRADNSSVFAGGEAGFGVEGKEEAEGKGEADVLNTSEFVVFGGNSGVWQRLK